MNTLHRLALFTASAHFSETSFILRPLFIWLLLHIHFARQGGSPLYLWCDCLYFTLYKSNFILDMQQLAVLTNACFYQSMLNMNNPPSNVYTLIPTPCIFNLTTTYMSWDRTSNFDMTTTMIAAVESMAPLAPFPVEPLALFPVKPLAPFPVEPLVPLPVERTIFEL